MKDASLFGVKYFSPSCGRSIFFQEYAEMNGISDLDDIDSLASVMGNSSKTLVERYAPARKKRLAQRLINERAHFANMKFQSSLLVRRKDEGGMHQSESGPSGLHNSFLENEDDKMLEDVEMTAENDEDDLMD